MKKRKTTLIAEKKLFRKSQATKNPPSKRLVKRRKANTKKGYFPNPKKIAPIPLNPKRRKVVRRSRRKNPVKKTYVGTPKMNYRIYQIADGKDTFACGCTGKETAKQICDILNSHAAGKAHFVVIEYGH